MKVIDRVVKENDRIESTKLHDESTELQNENIRVKVVIENVKRERIVIRTI